MEQRGVEEFKKSLYVDAEKHNKNQVLANAKRRNLEKLKHDQDRLEMLQQVDVLKQAKQQEDEQLRRRGHKVARENLQLMMF